MADVAGAIRGVRGSLGAVRSHPLTPVGALAIGAAGGAAVGWHTDTNPAGGALIGMWIGGIAGMALHRGVAPGAVTGRARLLSGVDDALRGLDELPGVANGAAARARIADGLEGLAADRSAFHQIGFVTARRNLDEIWPSRLRQAAAGIREGREAAGVAADLTRLRRFMAQGMSHPDAQAALAKEAGVPLLQRLKDGNVSNGAAVGIAGAGMVTFGGTVALLNAAYT